MKDYSIIIATAISFLITALSGIIIIPYLKKLKFGQTIRDEGPSWHEKKSGTPTMGGIMMIFGVLFSILVAFAYSYFAFGGFPNGLRNNSRIVSFVSVIFLAMGMAVIGFVDDYIKVVKKRNLGLTARQKTVFQLLVSAGYLLILYFNGMEKTWIPFMPNDGYIYVTKGFGLIFWPIALIYIYYFVNAVNLTDGIDGLCSSVTLVASCALLLLSTFAHRADNAILSSALAGACAGFLIWNSHPAKVFMGDTGSLFLGGMVVGLCFAIERPILLILVGIIYLCEALSVVLQVASFKLTGKRIFKMSPIHHHFELCKWSEEKIVFVFSIVTLIGGFVAILPQIFAK